MSTLPGLWVEKNGVPECIYEPQPHQARYHAATTLNCIMEGGAGSGKSKCMRFDAYMRCLSIPRFRSLILRRSMPELRMSHLDEVPFDVEKLGLPKEAWHSTNFTLRFPNGSVLVFGHVEDDTTIARYLSSEWDQIQFDELTTFTLRQFLFLSSRARTTKPGLKARVGGGTNPIGPGATWVRRYFIDKDISLDENPGYNPEDYEAQHSTVDNNKYVDVKDYEKRLNAMGNPALVQALRHGLWVIEGAAFPEWRDIDPETHKPWHVIDRLPTQARRSSTATGSRSSR
jgi:phage terminase large subunit